MEKKYGEKLNEDCTKRITKLRKDRNLTQTEMAEMLGLSLRSYSRYESNKDNDPKWTLEMIGDIAENFDVTTTYLLCGGEKEAPYLSEADVQIIKFLSSYSEEKKEKILEGLKMILDRN